jgi:hypothetical protein
MKFDPPQGPLSGNVYVVTHGGGAVVSLPREITDEILDRAADVAYGVYHPSTAPSITGRERAWRGPVQTNPMRRAVRAAIAEVFSALGAIEGGEPE